MTASVSPALTSAPSETTNRTAGPEIGASTVVARSLSKPTVPVVSMVRRNWEVVALSSRTRCRWAAVRVTLLATTEVAVAGGLSAGGEQPASSTVAVRATTGPRDLRVLFFMGSR